MPTTGPHAGKCGVPAPPDSYECMGKEDTLTGMPAYLTGSPSASSAILYISDILGWKVPQARRLADRVAAAGYYVVLPDFLDDDFFSPNPDNPPEGLDVYMARHSPPEAIARAGVLIEKLKSEGFQSIGVAGFCWGAKIAASLINGAHQVDAAVMLHPYFLLMEEIKAVKVPLAILGAEIDELAPPQMVLEFGAALAEIPEIGNKSMAKIFKGANHGFSTRYDPNDVDAVARAEEAYQDMVGWFNTYCRSSN